MAAEVVKRKESVRGETSDNEGKKKEKNSSSQVVSEGKDGDLKKKRKKKKEKMYEDDAVGENILGGTADGKECLDENTIVRAESSKKEKKSKKKERKEKGSLCSEGVSSECRVDSVDKNNSRVEGDGEGGDGKKKKRKKENRGVDCDGVAVRKGISGVMEVGGESNDLDANTADGVELSKKEKKQKKKKKKERKERQQEEEGKEKNSSQVEGNLVNTYMSGNGVGDGKPEVNASNLEGEHKDVKGKKRKRDKSGDTVVINSEPEYVSPNEGGDGQLEVDAVVTQDGNKNERKKKKRKRDKHGDDVVSNSGSGSTNQVEGNVVNADASGNEALEETANMLEKSKPKRTSKKVTFSQDVEVFPPSEAPIDEEAPVDEEGDVRKELVRGKRFSLEEDELIKKAVFNYIDTHQLGEEGIEKVMHCSKHKLRTCWKEIGEYLPWRPRESVYCRAHSLFQRDDSHSWTPEEIDVVRNYANKHAGKWKDLAAALGKNRVHVKDTWRRVRLANMKRGHWDQDEYQNLFDLVNKDMRMKVNEVKKTKHGMLRDNISWMAISTKLETRTDANCCVKWYEKLASPMVADGKWLDSDDYHLVIALYDLDAFCIEDVDWDNILEHRPGDICRKRWNQMVRHLGEHGNKPFSEQVEILSKRYCPDVLEAREAYNSNTAEGQSNTAEDCSDPLGIF